MEEESQIETLKKRGLTCAKLSSMEKAQLDDAQTFRKVGFNKIADAEESIARSIRSLKNKVCLLR